jgi:TP901 family phage tail tape measure protein
MSIFAGAVHGDLILDGRQYFTTLDKAQSQIKNFESRLEKSGQKMQSAGKSMTKAVTVPIVAAGAAVIKFGSDFESAMTASTAIMGDLSEAMKNDMEKTARDVARNTRFSAREAAESYFYLASAGLDAAQSIGALPKVASFAQAGNFDMARATDLLTDAQSALGLTVDDTTQNMENMVKVSDVLVKANTLSNATVEQFSESLTNKAGAALRLLNKDVEEGVAVLAAWADQGVKGEAAGEQLNIVFRDLQNAALKNEEAFEKFNVKVFDTDGNMRNIADIVGDLEGALDGMSDAQVRSTLTTMGFQDRSVSALLTLLGTSDAIREYETELRSASGVTEEVAGKQLKNLQDQFKLLKDRAIDTALSMYQNLAPTIENVVMPLADRFLTQLESLTKWFGNLDKSTQESIFKFMGFAAAAGPVLWAGGKVTSMVSGMVGGFGKFIGIGGKIIKTLAGTSTATAAATTAAGKAAGAAGFGGLAKSIGGAVVAAGPWALVAGAVVGGGLAIHQQLKKETIPTVDLFADKVEVTSEKVETSYGSMTKVIEENTIKISDATKQAVQAYMDLDDQATSAITSLYVNSTKITEDNANEIISTYDNMNAQVVAGMEAQHKDRYTQMQEFFNNSSSLRDSEEAEALESLNEYHAEQIKATEEGNERIRAILEEASAEKRALTRDEQIEINDIQDEMRSKAVSALSETEVESKIILERLKGYGERVTAEQASEMIKNANETRDKGIEAAEDLYTETVANIIRMRDETGIITADQADQLIDDAKRQRDEAIDKADELKNGVVDKIKEMNPEIEDAVDTQTGEIMTGWDKVKKWWNSWTLPPKSTSVTTKYNTIYQTTGARPISGRAAHNARGTDSFKGGLTWVGEQGPELMELPPRTKIYSNQKSEKMVGLAPATEKIQRVTVEVPLKIDGKQIARATASFTAQELEILRNRQKRSGR